VKGIHDSGCSVADIVSDPFGFTCGEIAGRIGEPDAKALFSLLYKNASGKKAQTMWAKDVFKDADTRKYVYELFDSRCIETVCIKRKTGVTACVSSQVGCSVGCAFCESGSSGLVRNLSPSEIVQQVVLLREKVNRIIFMGIGEPLHNYDALIKSIHILRDRSGLDFPTDGITVSTIGPIKQLKKLREEHIKIQLALSLHATTQETRDFIVPGMRENGVRQTVEAALSYSQRHGRKIVIAYLLLPGINDRPSDIKQLAEWFRRENVMVNLLEYNQAASRREIRKPSAREMAQFKSRLENCGLEVSVRVSHGRGIKAACGQLASGYNRGHS